MVVRHPVKVDCAGSNPVGFAGGSPGKIPGYLCSNVRTFGDKPRRRLAGCGVSRQHSPLVFPGRQDRNLYG